MSMTCYWEAELGGSPELANQSVCPVNESPCLKTRKGNRRKHAMLTFFDLHTHAHLWTCCTYTAHMHTYSIRSKKMFICYGIWDVVNLIRKKIRQCQNEKKRKRKIIVIVLALVEIQAYSLVSNRLRIISFAMLLKNKSRPFVWYDFRHVIYHWAIFAGFSSLKQGLPI